MQGFGQSDGLVVPMKPANEASERAEGRGSTKGNSREQNKLRTQGRERLKIELERVHQVAKKESKTQFTALYHQIYSVDCLREAYRRLKKDAAPGVDGQTWQTYGENLESKLLDLSSRLKMGAYQPKPVRRVHIPKNDGTMRPLGVTALEDKIVQAAAVMVLNTIYEVDFAGFSYGFRPKRSQHQALDALTTALTMRKVSWVLDADIRGFFDAINHEWLIKFVAHRIADQRVLRLIRKWLRAGVMEDGNYTQQEDGTPQGGCISPLLGNIYLHYVYDLWVLAWRKKHSSVYGEVINVRYADDTIAGFQNKLGADLFLSALIQRLERFGLELHPDKTRLIEFGRFATENRRKRNQGKPETFQFLGFTHIVGKSRTNGKFTVVRNTAKKRFCKKLQEVKDQLRQRMNRSVPEVGKWLGSVLRGHYQYYGVPSNYKKLEAFHYQVKRCWFRTLRRRSHKHNLKWERMQRLADRWLPTPHIVHPYPIERFHVTT